MVQAFLPKIHRTRRKILRQLARQRHIMSQTEEFGQPLGEYPSSSSSLPSGGGGGMGGGEGLFLEKPPCSSGDMYCVADECPADMTCPAGGMARDFSEKPGPMPGIRPPMGGAGGMVPPPQGKGSGAMGIIMPLYTVGIVVFFVYTIMKVLFKKGPDDDKTPKLKDFGLDPEYRKYVFAEEYLDNAEISTRDQMRRQAREESRSRKKVQQDQVPDTKIEDEQLDHLRRRLEETEKAMERLMCQMGSVTDKLMTAKITEVLSQAQAQAKILKEEVGDITSEEELTSSEALTTTMSEDNSLPTSLQQHLHALQNEDSPISSKGSSPDMEEYEVINKDEDTAHKLRTQRETSSGEPVIDKVKAAESTEVSSQAAQLHTGEEAPSEKENETQKEEKVVKGKERSRSKEPEEKKSSDKANVCEDQGKDSPSCPVDDSSSAKATDPEATLCTPSDSLGAEEGQTDIDSSTSKENVSSDNADSE